MSKHGATVPRGMIQKSARDTSQPSQAQLDHTAQMNTWFVESFNNLFATTFTPLADALGDANDKRANQILRRVYCDMREIKSDLHLIKMLMMSPDVKVDDVAAKFAEVKSAIVASIDHELPYYGDADPEEDANIKAEFDAVEPIEFKFDLHPETAPPAIVKTVEAARARNRVGWLNMLKGIFK